MPRYETLRWGEIAALDVDLPATVLGGISEAERAVQSLNQPLLAHQLGALAPRLLRAESVASSWIEGLRISQRRLARAEVAGTSARDDTARAVLGNVAAMEALVALADGKRPLRRKDLLEVHRMLMELTPDPEGAGSFRTRQNWIGDNPHSPANADHVPPPPDHVERLMEDLLAFVARDDLPPVFQAAVAHAQFEAIHPFADGNGRTGRALVHYILRRRGLAPRFVPPVSLVLATHRDAYVRGLDRYNHGGKAGLVEWLRTFGWAVQKASRKSEELADRVVRLQAAWRERAGHPRADSSAEALIRALPANPFLTPAVAAEISGRSAQAANLALNELAAAGILRSVSAGPRRRAFEAPELLALVNAFEHELAVPEGEARPVRPAPSR